MDFPMKFLDLEPDKTEQLKSQFTGNCCGYVRVGPKGYLLSANYKKEAVKIYNFSLRPEDAFVISTPRSGSTWLQELVWLVANDLNYEKAAKIPKPQRFPFLEVSMFYDPETLKKIANKHTEKLFEKLSTSSVDMVNKMPSPRFIKSHLPLSLFPPNLLDECKVIYITRDPRDVAVSFYHHNKLIQLHGYTGDFKTYWNLFINDFLHYTPFFECVKESWDKRHHPNMLFLFYEELSQDLQSVVQKVSSFLNKQLTDDQVKVLCEYLNIENFKKNRSVNLEGASEMGLTKAGEEPFIRKGKVGGWRSYFDEEMTKQAERWISDNLRGTDLLFPQS